jgi:acyl-CoA thioesterase-1
MASLKNTSMLRFLVLLLVATVLLAACGSHSKEAALPAGSVVLALGDSLTAGAGVSTEQAWPALLEKRTGWEIINGGVNGDTSAQGLQRLPNLLEQHNPQLVLVTLGGNDMLRHIPQQETAANLGRILALVKAHGAKAVLVATPEPNLMSAVFQHLSAPPFYKQVAEQQQVPLIDNAVAEVLSDPQLKGDQVHPNAAGHALLAEKIFRELQSIGYAR